jgi:hypothetical protein
MLILLDKGDNDPVDFMDQHDIQPAGSGNLMRQKSTPIFKKGSGDNNLQQ